LRGRLGLARQVALARFAQFLLCLGTEARHALHLPRSACAEQLLDGADAQRVVQQGDAPCGHAGHANQLRRAGRVRRPQLFEQARAAAVPQLVDLARQRGADALQLAQPILLDARTELVANRFHHLRALLVGVHFEARGPVEAQKRRNLAERFIDLLCVLHGAHASMPHAGGLDESSLRQ